MLAAVTATEGFRAGTEATLGRGFAPLGDGEVPVVEAILGRGFAPLGDGDEPVVEAILGRGFVVPEEEVGVLLDPEEADAATVVRR